MSWEYMSRTDTIDVLKLIVRFDPRIGDSEDDVKGWQIGLGGLSPARCKEAVAVHYRDSTERIMPAHVRRLARTTTDGETHSPTAAPPGEILCGQCARVHRPDESCEALERRPWPRPLGSVTKALTAAPEEPWRTGASTSAAHERALQRARGERGNVPWTGDAPPPEPEVERPREERDYQHQPGAVTAEDAPPSGLGPSQCRCGAVFLDYPAGRSAHRAVFGHDPRGVVPQRAEAGR